MPTSQKGFQTFWCGFLFCLMQKRRNSETSGTKTLLFPAHISSRDHFVVFPWNSHPSVPDFLLIDFQNKMREGMSKRVSTLLLHISCFCPFYPAKCRSALFSYWRDKPKTNYLYWQFLNGMSTNWFALERTQNPEGVLQACSTTTWWIVVFSEWWFPNSKHCFLLSPGVFGKRCTNTNFGPSKEVSSKTNYSRRPEKRWFPGTTKCNLFW